MSLSSLLKVNRKGLLYFLIGCSILLNLGNNLFHVLNYKEQRGMPMFVYGGHFSYFELLNYDYFVGPDFHSFHGYPYQILIVKIVLWSFTLFGLILLLFKISIGRIILIVTFTLFALFLGVSIYYLIVELFTVELQLLDTPDIPRSMVIEGIGNTITITVYKFIGLSISCYIIFNVVNRTLPNIKYCNNPAAKL
jgi:hypothetical protein